MQHKDFPRGAMLVSTNMVLEFWKIARLRQVSSGRTIS